MKTILSIILLALSLSTHAGIITFENATLTNSVGIKTVQVGDWLFSTPNYGHLTADANGLSNTGVNLGGSPALLQIQRVDGGSFSFDSLEFVDHAGYVCGLNFCGTEALILRNNRPGFINYTVDGVPSTTDFFTPSLKSLLFGQQMIATIETNDAYLIKSFGLTTVPLPGSVWMMLIGFFMLAWSSKCRLSKLAL